MKIGIGVTLWKRHDVAKLVMERYARLRDELRGKITLDLVAVGSEGDASRKLAERAGWEYGEFPNDPKRLQPKFCRTLELLRPKGDDALMVVGSDDFADKTMILTFAERIRQGFDLVGQMDYYEVNASFGEAIYWPGYADRRKGEPIGPFRLMTPKLLDKMDWRPWTNEGNDHDTHSFKILTDLATKPAMLYARHYRYHCFGLQAGTNQTSWRSIVRSPGVTKVPVSSALVGCTPEELAAIDLITKELRKMEPQSFMISAAEKHQLELAAAASGKPLEEWVRHVLLHVARTR